MYAERREYRKRKGLPWAWWVFILAQLLLVALRLDDTGKQPGWPLWLMAGGALALLSMCIWLAVRLSNGRTWVGPGGVTTRGALIHRHRDWLAIYDIRMHPNRTGAMVPKRSTWAYGTDGRRLPLFFVDDRHCDDLLEEVAAIRAAGAAWRGTPWTTVPEAEERIRRRALRRESRDWAFVCMMYSYLLTLPLFCWRISHGQDGRPLLLLLWGPLSVLLTCLTLLRSTEQWRPTRISRGGEVEPEL
ncbi:hypothetical protein [Actinacidiphila glaucinigra]|uniref:hypothetical protein n=1 Tax=Actinacidiphila glaucinigra TaxID=235986 RepID=UPI0037168401